MFSKSILLALFAVLAVASITVLADERLDELDSAANDVADSLADVSPENKKEATTLQKLLDQLLERIRVRVQDRHQSAQDLIEKAKEITSRLEELHVRKGQKVQEMVERLQGRVKELIESFIDKLTGRARNTRSITSDEELLEQLNLDRLMVETFIRSQVDGGLKRHRRQAKQDPLAQIREIFVKIRDHLFGRYKEFTEWLLTVWNNGIKQAQGHHERLMAIAKEVIADAQDMQKETLREALEILKPYREELGSTWFEVVESVKKALKA